MSADATFVTFALDARCTFNNDGGPLNIPERTLFIGDEDPLEIWWFISGQLVDFSTGYTFIGTLAATNDPTSAVFTKSTGFTGATGSGVEGDDGTPNLVVAWPTTGELNNVDEGQYIFQIVATAADTSQSTYQMYLNMKSRVG